MMDGVRREYSYKGEVELFLLTLFADKNTDWIQKGYGLRHYFTMKGLYGGFISACGENIVGEAPGNTMDELRLKGIFHIS